MKASEVYQRHVRSLPAVERLRLVELIARDLAADSAATLEPTRDIMDLHGLGKEIWEGVDPTQYVDALRAELDDRP